MGFDQIQDFNFYAALLVGFMSSAHCIVMCGGVASILSANIPLHHNGWTMRLFYQLAYNLGRISSYCIAGALLGYSFGFFAVKSHLVFTLLQLVSGVMLILVGLYITQWLNIIVYVERLGKGLWSLLSPLAKRLIPFQSPAGAVSFGIIWGWLPCGLVYSTLTWSAASGSAAQGALIMLGFGLGTLPTMLAVGFVSGYLKSLLEMKIIKYISGLVIIIYGVNQIHRSVF